MNIYIKVIYCQHFEIYTIDTNWSPSELYRNLRQSILNDFNISNYELLDTISYYNGKPEDKQKIESINYISLNRLYGNEIKNLAIYIRPI